MALMLWCYGSRILKVIYLHRLLDNLHRMLIAWWSRYQGPQVVFWYSDSPYTRRLEHTNLFIPDKWNSIIRNTGFRYTGSTYTGSSYTGQNVPYMRQILAYRIYCPVYRDLVYGVPVFAIIPDLLSGIRGSSVGVVRCINQAFCDSYSRRPL